MSAQSSPVLQRQAASAPAHPAVLGSDVISAELNTFFPFDPYNLPKSGSYIQSVYREWSAVALDEEDDDEEEDSEEEGEGEEAETDNDSTNLHRRYLDIPPTANSIQLEGKDGLGASFEGMSISPVVSALS